MSSSQALVAKNDNVIIKLKTKTNSNKALAHQAHTKAEGESKATNRRHARTQYYPDTKEQKDKGIRMAGTLEGGVGR